MRKSRTAPPRNLRRERYINTTGGGPCRASYRGWRGPEPADPATHEKNTHVCARVGNSRCAHATRAQHATERRRKFFVHTHRTCTYARINVGKRPPGARLCRQHRPPGSPVEGRHACAASAAITPPELLQSRSPAATASPSGSESSILEPLAAATTTATSEAVVMVAAIDPARTRRITARHNEDETGTTGLSGQAGAM